MPKKSGSWLTGTRGASKLSSDPSGYGGAHLSFNSALSTFENQVNKWNTFIGGASGTGTSFRNAGWQGEFIKVKDEQKVFVSWIDSYGVGYTVNVGYGKLKRDGMLAVLYAANAQRTNEIKAAKKQGRTVRAGRPFNKTDFKNSTFYIEAPGSSVYV